MSTVSCFSGSHLPMICSDDDDDNKCPKSFGKMMHRRLVTLCGCEWFLPILTSIWYMVPYLWNDAR